MSEAKYREFFAVVETSPASTRAGFDARWTAIACIIAGELWTHGGWRSEWQFLARGVGIPPRLGRRLARIAAKTSAWPHRDEAKRKLEVVARLHEELARVGGAEGDVPIARRAGAGLEPQTAVDARRRDLRRTTKVLRRMDDGALQRRELVVLLHGLGRTRSSMSKAEKALQSAGFLTVNIGYDSRKGTIAKLAGQVWQDVEAYAGEFERVHFLTHSLGGVLVRQLLNKGRVKTVGRVVMLAPPNHGSEVVDELRKRPIVPWVMGPAFLELGTGPEGPVRLGPARAPTAVIAASRTQWPFSLAFSGPNDGKVSVASARLEGMEAFLVVDENHTRLMRSPEVLEAVVSYLKTGKLRSADEALVPLEVGDFQAARRRGAWVAELRGRSPDV